MSVALRAFQLYFPTNYMVHNFEISTFTILLLLYHHPKKLMQKYSTLKWHNTRIEMIVIQECYTLFLHR